MSASLSSSLILALSIEARGRVFRPVAAQNSEMFCETMPASSAPHSNFCSGVPRRKRSESETRMIWTGGLDGRGGGRGKGSTPCHTLVCPAKALPQLCPARTGWFFAAKPGPILPSKDCTFCEVVKYLCWLAFTRILCKVRLLSGLPKGLSRQRKRLISYPYRL